MRVFVTGASGFIGSAVLPELTAAGHQVVGLARSDASAAVIAGLDVEPERGSLEDLDVLRRAAASADGVIHLGFVHDFSRYDESVRIDEQAIEAMGAALAGSDRPFVIASGIAAERDADAPATEQDAPAPMFPRSAAALRTIALVDEGVRSSVVRLPPTVHGEGDQGFVPMLIDIARTKGMSGYVGDGANRWPAVHRLDAARLFRLALERAPGGSVLHAIDDEGIPTREIAETIGRHLEVPVVSIDPDSTAEHFGWLGLFFATDLLASSALTRELLSWQPAQPKLIDDLDKGHYFEGNAIPLALTER
jgi:nucleoside-diphosphate-sugar epimerase